MEILYLLFGFAGSWLIFAGSIYQATIELSSEGIERERVQQYMDAAPIGPKISRWWWLVPPVKYLLEHRRLWVRREQALRLMPADELEALINFGNKASGWMLVALGGVCIAAKETYELAEHFEWALWLYALIVIAMAALSIINANLRSRNSERLKRLASR